MTEEQRPKVGIGVMILKEGNVLLGRRKNSHGQGEYSFPGGHLEYQESFEMCARREVLEECGVEVTNMQFLCVTNGTYPNHYVTLILISDWKSNEPCTLEPEKCEGWNWYSLDNLPSPLFRESALGIESYKTGKNYFDKVE